MGIIALISQAGPEDGHGRAVDVAKTSLMASLNVLLTLMIAFRLVLHDRNVRASAGSRAGISGLYKNISAIFIESCALLATNALLVFGLTLANSSVRYVFEPTLSEIQVCAFLGL
jgi:hypothetical protein